MPTYDYLCESCGHEVEIFQSGNDKPKRTCPQCKSRKFRRLIGAGAGVIFKGSGFYGTDYRSSSYASDAKKDSDSKDSSSKDKASGTDKKSSAETPKSSSAPAPKGGSKDD